MVDFFWDIATGGVNYSIQGNGGEVCMKYIPTWQRLCETALFVPIALFVVFTTMPILNCSFTSRPRQTSRYAILTLYSLIFGAELGFKMMSRRTCFLFRLNMYFMPGAFFALAFPVLNTRILPGEVFVYYAQHLAIVIVPLYLMYIRGAFEPEKAHDYVWTAFGLCVFLLYHFIVLQGMALYSRVNLNNIMCPATSDPFQSRAYRVIAVAHQFLLIPIITKTYSAVAYCTIAIYSELHLGNWARK